MSFVLDASMALSWFFRDELTAAGRAVRARLETETAWVPSVFPIEMANALAVAERRGRIAAGEADEIVGRLLTLAIILEEMTAARALQDVLEVARSNRLSAYDAAYLELAMRENLPLATLDRELRAAADRCGIDILPA